MDGRDRKEAQKQLAKSLGKSAAKTVIANQYGSTAGSVAGGALGAYDAYGQWKEGDKTGAAVSLAGQYVPYLGAAYGAYKIGTGDMTNEQKAEQSRKLAEDVAIGVGTGGIGTLVQAADRAFLGGQTDKLRTKADSYNPMKKYADKLGTKVFAKFGSHKSSDQVQRDAVRKALLENKIIDDQWGLNFKSGDRFNIGLDGGAKLNNLDGSTRRQYEIDPASLEAAQVSKWATPLAQLLSGGDEKLSKSFGGYFTNAALSGGNDINRARANLQDLSGQFGLNRDQIMEALGGIKDKLGTNYDASVGGINDLFGPALRTGFDAKGNYIGTPGRRPKKNQGSPGRRPSR